MRSSAKPLLVILIAFVAVMSMALWVRPHETVPWKTDFRAAQAESQRTGKPMLLDFTADWCGPCQEMRRTTWSDHQVAKALEQYVAVQVDLDNNAELASRFAVNAIPYLVVLDANGHVLQTSEGLLSPEQFIGWLRSVPATRPATAP